MTIFDFKLLSQREQLDLLYEQGVYVGKRKQGDTTVILYQLESFYVEIFYSKYRCFILAVSCFSSMHRLDPYLSQVDVEHLVNI